MTPNALTGKAESVYECPSRSNKFSALCTTFQALGLLITILRLGYRVRTRMLWVEDMWAVAALVCGAVSVSCCTCDMSYVSQLKATMTSALTCALTGGHKSVHIIDWCGLIYFLNRWPVIDHFFLGMLFYLSISHLVSISPFYERCRLNDKIRAVRQSILFSLARIFWSTRSLRCITYTIAFIFLVFYGALVSQKAWQFGHNLNWYNHPDHNGKVRAYLTRPMVIFELISETLILNQIMTTDEFANSGLCFRHDPCITFLAPSVGGQASNKRTDDDLGNVLDECIRDTRFDFPHHLPTYASQEYLAHCS